MDDLAAVCLESAAEVAEPHAGDACDQPVRDPGRKDASRIVSPVATPSAHNVVSLVDLLEEVRDVMWVVLQVAVQEDQHVAAAEVDPRLHGRRLPEVAAKADDPGPRVPRRKLPELVGAPVAAAVVDIQDLEGGAEGFQ